MYQFPCLVLLLLIKSICCADLDQLSEEAQFNEHNFEAFEHFGDKVTLGQKPIPLSLSLNSNLEQTFEHNLIIPKPQVELPHTFNLFTPHGQSGHAGHSGQPAVRYTSTPVETYQVTEEVYEPKPIPQVVPTPGKPPLILGSGSLGIVNLGHGKYALGSGSLGYSQPATAQQLSNKPEGGGLHVVPPPHLGSSEAFDAAFNNFDFKPLHQFFGH